MKITLDLPNNTQMLLVNALYTKVIADKSDWTIGTAYCDNLKEGIELKLGSNNESS